MKAQISAEGVLLIERAGTMKEQHCVNRHAHLCCDACPMFGEPGWHDPQGPGGRKFLTLCQGRDLIGKIEDLRPRPGNSSDVGGVCNQAAPAAAPSDADGGL